MSDDSVDEIPDCIGQISDIFSAECVSCPWREECANFSEEWKAQIEMEMYGEELEGLNDEL